MSDYGFKISVEGQSEEQLKKIEAAIKSVGATHAEETNRMKDGVSSLGSGLEELRNQIVAAFAVERLYEFGKELLNVTAEFQGFDNVIKYSSLNVVDASENISFLKDTINDLHLPMREAYQGFQEMQAGLVGTGVEGERLRGLFRGFETMETVLHQPAYMQQRAMYDLKELGEVGLNKRMERMLKQSLPGIQKIVQETFGKTMSQLQAEGMPGGEFLVKLGEGMQKHFAPGLPNASKSLISQMNDAQTALLETMRNMGEKLTPIFTNILNSIREAFNSGPAQWFIRNIEEIVKVAGTLLEVWITYKGILFVTSLITETFAIKNGILTVSMGDLTVMTDGASVAVEGFGAVLNTIAWGAIAFGIVEIVSQFSDMAKALDEVDEKLYHLQKYQSGGNALTDATSQDYKDLMQAMSGKDMTMINEGYNKTIADMKTAQKQVFDTRMDYIAALKDRDSTFNKLFENEKKYSGQSNDFIKEKIEHGAVDAPDPNGLMTHYLRLGDILPGLAKALGSAKGNLGLLDNYAGMYKGAGATGKISYSPYINPETGHKKGALSMVDMTGAKGGLGEAKIINMAIGVVQQNNGVKESAAEADHAVQMITRAINNLSASQSQTY